MCKGCPTIGGSRKTDVGSSTIVKTTHLEGGDDGVAKGKGVRFKLRHVLACLVGEGVAADLLEASPKGEKGG